MTFARVWGFGVQQRNHRPSEPQIFGPMTWVCFPGHVYVVRCSTLRHVKEEQLYRQILDGKYEFDVGKPRKKTVKVCPTIIILKWILVVDEK